MSTEIMSLTFEDLINIPKVDLSSKIQPGVAVEVTLSFQAEDISNCDIYKSWSTVLFQHYGPSKISATDLNELLKAFTLSIKELIDACQGEGSGEKSKDLLAFLGYTSELFTWIHSVTTEFCLNELTTFLCFGLTVVDSLLAVINNRSGFKRFLQKSLALQTQILNILSTSAPSQAFNVKDVVFFSDLVSLLCSIGEKTPKLDIKTAVETWKATTKLLSQNTALSEHESITDNTWLVRPMRFLIQEIGRNVQTVYNEDSLNEPIQQIEKYLKVTNFYLKLLQKITADFRHVAFPVCKEFADNLMSVCCPPQKIAGSPVEKLITEYVVNGFKDLIKFAYKNQQFFKALLSKESDDFEENERLYEILLEVLEMAMRRNEIQFLDDTFFAAVFKKCLSSSYMVLATRSYNRLVEVFAELQTRFRPEDFERELVQIVLQDDITLASAAMDVWCIIFRNSHHSDRLMYMKFWREVNAQFAKFSNQLSSLYVESLVKRLYSMLTIGEKEEIWSQFDACMLTNDRFLLAVGLEAIPNEIQRRKVIKYFVDELKRFLKECARDMTIDNFYSIVRDIKLLTPIAINCEELNEMLFQYLEISIEHNKFDLLTESILNFIAFRLESMKDNKVLGILTALSKELPRFEGYQMKICLFEFLKIVAKNSRLREHAVKILKILESDELINHFGCGQKQTSSRSNQAPNVVLLRDIVKNRSLEIVDGTHVCQSSDEIPAKRMRKDVDDVIASLEATVDKLESIAKAEPLDSCRVQIIKQIAKRLDKMDCVS